MRITRTVLIAAVAFVCFASQVAEGAVVAYYELDGNADATVGNDGTENGSTNYVPGQFGQAVDLTGSNFIDGMGAAIPAGSFTLAAWVNADADVTTLQYIAGVQDSGDSGYRALRFRGDDVTNRVEADIIDDGDGFNPLVFAPVTPNGWTHVAMTFDDATNTERLYVNGALQGTDLAVGNTTIVQSNFTIGARPDKTNENRFDGQIDDVIVFDEALDLNGIIQLRDEGGFSFLQSSTVPEPSTLLLAAFGLAGLAMRRRRRNRA
ncbi:MAG: PEP-CTERM sorting domain-containing protein [Pirellulales bacterium]|nr:PEP-CTERM sorting domain-containing protein [Pirellulales bacterium]